MLKKFSVGLHAVHNIQFDFGLRKYSVNKIKMKKKTGYFFNFSIILQKKFQFWKFNYCLIIYCLLSKTSRHPWLSPRSCFKGWMVEGWTKAAGN